MPDEHEPDEQILERKRLEALERGRAHREEQQARLHERLDLFIAEVYEKCPRAEDGEEMVFKLTGYSDGHDRHGDFDYVSFHLETRRSEGQL